MSVSELYRCARSLEAIEDYARASFSTTPNDVDLDTLSDNADAGTLDTSYVYSDEEFWREILAAPDVWGRSYKLQWFAMSEWVARVPGLFWTKDARWRRMMSESAVQYESREWKVYEPLGKSRKVEGGVGTLKFPPDEHGRRLISLSAGLNASTGIPALISADVWTHHRLGEGRFIDVVHAKWQSMFGTTWAERFPSIKGIPKGFLVVNEPPLMVNSNRSVPTQFHPCTVMEYYRGNAKLYDLVYATADTGDPGYRSKLERFFDYYKKDAGRYGRYLLAADVGEPLWEAEYDSPSALLRADQGAKSQLELLQARVRADSFKGQSLDEIVHLLARLYDGAGLQRISRSIDIATGHWYKGGTSADSAVELLRLCLERNKVEELLDAIGQEYPAAII